METSVTSYWMPLNFRYVPEKGKKGKRREHIPLAEGCLYYTETTGLPR